MHKLRWKRIDLDAHLKKLTHCSLDKSRDWIIGWCDWKFSARGRFSVTCTAFPKFLTLWNAWAKVCANQHDLLAINSLPGRSHTIPFPNIRHCIRSQDNMKHNMIAFHLQIIYYRLLGKNKQPKHPPFQQLPSVSILSAMFPRKWRFCSLEEMG